MIKVSSAGFTDVGKIRENNEDNFYVNGKYKKDNSVISGMFDECEDNSDREQYLYAVCDGIGGEKFGEVASLIAVKTLVKYQSENIKNVVNDYISDANRRICDEIEKNKGVIIGTTLALLYIKEDKAIAYNVGDSRVYLFRKNKLIQLSEDHTQAQRLFKMGMIKQNEIRTHKDKNKLTQHLGIFPNEVAIEAHSSDEIILKKDDIFILCSDGLTDMVTDKKISKILSDKKLSAYSIASKLSQTAIDNGGKDNVTVVAVKIGKSTSLFSGLFPKK